MATKTKFNNEELIRLAKNGDEGAKEELFKINRGLNFYIAKRFENTKMEIDDLISVSNIGMIKAYNTFDLNKGTKFISYASRIMTNEILMYLRKDKKHNGLANLEQTISQDMDGNNLTLMEVIPAPEDNIKTEDYDLMQYVLNIFNKEANERDKIVLKKCIINNETQRKVANELGFSQSYIARLIIRVERMLKNIAETGKYNYTTTNNIKRKRNVEGDVKIEIKKKVVKKYTKNDYLYIIKNYPNLSAQDIANVMGVKNQSVRVYKSKAKCLSKDYIVTDINSELIAKLDKYSLDKVNFKSKTDIITK